MGEREKTTLPKDMLPGFCHSAENVADALQKEETVREKTDEQGIAWTKVYFGSGSHFKNWLSQVCEIYGEDNIQVETVDFTGLTCFEESDDKACRIWVKKKPGI